MDKERLAHARKLAAHLRDVTEDMLLQGDIEKLGYHPFYWELKAQLNLFIAFVDDDEADKNG